MRRQYASSGTKNLFSSKLSLGVAFFLNVYYIIDTSIIDISIIDVSIINFILHTKGQHNMNNYQKTNDFNEIVYGRRSIKVYDPTVKISREEMSGIIAQASKAPSSINMQPWRFVIIDSEEGKEKVVPLSKFNKEKVSSSSAVIAVFADMKNFDYAEEIYSKAVELGYMPQEVKDYQLGAFKPVYERMTDEDMKDTIMLDAGLVSMQLMLVARAYGYDTNPIGGYEKDQIAEALDMDKERYLPVMLITIGKALDEGFQSYRLPVETTTTWK